MVLFYQMIALKVIWLLVLVKKYQILYDKVFIMPLFIISIFRASW